MITLWLLVRATYMYGVVLHAHPVCDESYNQRNTTGEVATATCWLQPPSSAIHSFLLQPEMRNRRKNQTAPDPELFISWTWLRSSSGFCSFFHINIFNCRWASIWLENEIYLVHKAKGIYHTDMSRLIQKFYTISALVMRRSTNKQQPQIQMIQRTVTNRNITQVWNINKFCNGSHWFWRQCLRTFCYLLRPESRKSLFGKLHLCQSI